LVAEIVPHRFALPVRLIGEQVRMHTRAADEVCDQSNVQLLFIMKLIHY